MNEREFLDELAKLKNRCNWVLLAGFMIRCNQGCDCPITAVAKALGVSDDDTTCDEAVEMGRRLSLDASLVDGIILSADLRHSTELREKMINILQPEPA